MPKFTVEYQSVQEPDVWAQVPAPQFMTENMTPNEPKIERYLLFNGFDSSQLNHLRYHELFNLPGIPCSFDTKAEAEEYMQKCLTIGQCPFEMRVRELEAAENPEEAETETVAA